MRSLALADSVHTCHVLSSWRWLGVDLGQDSGRQLALTPGLVKMVGCAVAPHRGDVHPQGVWARSRTDRGHLVRRDLPGKLPNTCLIRMQIRCDQSTD